MQRLFSLSPDSSLMQGRARNVTLVCTANSPAHDDWAAAYTLADGKRNMQRQKIGILGATGMVGQRFIQLLEHHPWFEVAWLAASDRSSGKRYAEVAKWKLDTAIPERIAAMEVSPAQPDGAPSIIFAALDADIARELEPRFAAAGCAVIS